MSTEKNKSSDIKTVKLNERQQQAVVSTEGRVRIIAGAGSGKTRVLAHRFAFLVNEIGVSPGNILCLTFTNKAAQEMKQRISKLVDRGSVNDFVCTIHSFCVKFLRREIYRIGYPKSFTIIDEEDAKGLAKVAMNDFGIDRKKTTAERFLKQVAGVKGWDPDAYIQKYLLPNSPSETPDAIARYIRLQLKEFALDYDDLLYITLYILGHFPDAREYWIDKLNYIMIDEVQDCSGDDWKLFEAIAAGHNNLFIVGDPDQAIYEWRGANPKIFINFKADTDIVLNQNYRSTPDILSVANAIIANNQNRIPKDLFTVKLNDTPVVWRHCTSQKEEAEKIATQIADETAKGASPADYAVLYRASHSSRQIEQALLKYKIPYTVWGGVRFFERKEIKDTLAYLRVIASDHDDTAFRRIINLPSRKFGSTSLKKLQQLSEQENTPLFLTLCNHIDDKSFNKASLHEFIALIENARLLAQTTPVSELTDYILRQSALLDMLRNDEEEERLENISELISAMREFEKSRAEDNNDESTVYSYLQDVALYTNADYKSDSQRVRLMTIHQSKGLEFPTVFVIGLTEGNFPSHRTIRERRKDGEEEERRLMYVAVTRAEDRLYLSDSEGYMNDNGAMKFPSRFLSEIPEQFIEIEGKVDPSLLQGTKNLVKTLNEELGDNTENPWKPGTKVKHKIFGIGEIISYDAANKSYKVKFSNDTRNLLQRVLEIITT
ncbi:MAG: ATP-dependent helicase [Prevotella sp.]|nr:ATP-dependent helicase [Bacteroides sp.]MCM1366325.1 ATP-dependent helicase [Prevotella sp.]MCM1437129.1 ATP-dependent helicase [Prevotella sp.]